MVPFKGLLQTKQKANIRAVYTTIGIYWRLISGRFRVDADTELSLSYHIMETCLELW